MSFQYDESLMNFDLDFLHQTSNKVVDLNEKCRKTIGLTKKKIVATDLLIRKYYEKKEDVEHLEKVLYTTKDECKKAYIDIQTLTDKCTQLENEALILQTANQELQNKCSHSESVASAIQSHANQLQVLVKENETTIQSLKIENQLLKASLRDCDKKISTFQKEKDVLSRHIYLMKDIIFGKRKLSATFKDLLENYTKQYENYEDDSLLGDDISDNEIDVDHLPIQPISLEGLPVQSSKDIQEKNGKFVLTKDDDVDSDFSNEPASADTGRGSSLAFSDADKCFHSPDYFMDHSPISTDVKENIRRIYVDTATSPIPSIDIVHITSAASPSPMLHVDVATSPMTIYSTNEIIVTIEASDETSCNQLDKISNIDSKCPALEDIEEAFIAPEDENDTITDLKSSINTTELNLLHNINSKLLTTPDCITNQKGQIVDSSSKESNIGCKQNKSNKISKEKICLELNNREKFEEYNERDCEVEMILSKMRLNHPVVTPIPLTPTQSSLSSGHRSRLSCINASNEYEYVCKDAVKVREANKILQEQINQLVKDVNNLKTCLETSHSFLKQPTTAETELSEKHIIETSHLFLKQPTTAETELSEKHIIETSHLFLKQPTTAETELIEKNIIETSHLYLKQPTTAETELIEKNIIETSHLYLKQPTTAETELIEKNIIETSHSFLKQPITAETELIEKNIIVIPQDSQKDLYESPTQCDSINVIELNKQNDNISTSEIPKDFRKSVKRLEFEESMSISLQNNYSKSEQDLQLNNDNPSDESLNQSKDSQDNLCNLDTCLIKTYKHRKLTKLERFRQKLLPKTKIKRVSSPPIKKMQRRHRQMLALRALPENNKLDATSNNKNAYEKALKVMSELKSQQKSHDSKHLKAYKNSKSRKNNDSMTVNANLIKSHLSTESLNQLDKMHNSSTLIDQQTSIHSSNKQICILEDILITKAHNFNKKDKIKHILTKKFESNVLPSTREANINKDTLEPTSNENKELITLVSSGSDINPTHKAAFTSNNNIEKLSPVIENKYVCLNKSSETNNADMNITTKTNPNNSIPDSPSKMNCQTECVRELVIPIIKCDDPIEINHLDKNFSTPKKFIATRSKTKYVEDINKTSNSPHKNVNTCLNDEVKRSAKVTSPVEPDKNITDAVTVSRKRQRWNSVDKPDSDCKRMLRSSTISLSKSDDSDKDMKMDVSSNQQKEKVQDTILPSTESHKSLQENIISYGDLDLFNENDEPSTKKPTITNSKTSVHPKQSILCVMLDKYGKQSIKNFSKKIPGSTVTAISKTIEKEIAAITDVHPNDVTWSMKKFIAIIKKWEPKLFIAGLMEYLKDHKRKVELFNKIMSPPAPPMTKSEQILLYVLNELKTTWPSIDIVEAVLCNIEYTLFKLNRTPEFDTIESMSHAYAVICRYYKLKSRLRLFMLDAMYCIQFKAVSLIKQCLDVWMHVLPLAHMGIARSPLVTCMVYLLHFYKCEDKFNRVQEIRNILSRRYFYEITEWNEPKILEMFRNAIRNLRANPVELKLLRMALIVIAKRHGPKWCQKNIIKDLLLPVIEKDEYSRNAKLFCVSILGPLLKPFPADMKVHCEIVMNMFMDMLNQNPSPQMEEAIFTSLIYMSRHNFNRVLQSLITCDPRHTSPEFEDVMCDFVREKPLRVWKSILVKLNLT